MKLPLSGMHGKNRFVEIDSEDYDKLSKYRWHVNDKSYAITTVYSPMIKGVRTTTHIRMHRFITEAPLGMEVDHINGDTLDNRKENLRVCTHKENLWNSRRSRRNKSGVKGVFYDKKRDRYMANIYSNGHTKFLGLFRDKKDAANAYAEAAKVLRGEFINLGTGE